jgi:hypothetical protein
MPGFGVALFTVRDRVGSTAAAWADANDAGGRAEDPIPTATPISDPRRDTESQQKMLSIDQKTGLISPELLPQWNGATVPAHGRVAPSTPSAPAASPRDASANRRKPIGAVLRLARPTPSLSLPKACTLEAELQGCLDEMASFDGDETAAAVALACQSDDSAELARLLAEHDDAKSPIAQWIFEGEGAPDGATALMLAAMFGSAACVERLLPLSDPTARDRAGETALMLAVAGERGLRARRTYSLHSGESTRSGSRGDPSDPVRRLFEGVQNRRVAMVQRLLAVSDANAQNREGETALMLAIRHGHEALAQALLPASDLAVRDTEGRDALACARQARNAQCVAWIEAKALAGATRAAQLDAGEPSRAATKPSARPARL